MNLIPNFSPTITTSPLAILVPFANMSKGSPASRSSSTTEPSFSLSKSLIFISVFPTSTVSFTSIFSKTLRLLTAAEPCSATFSLSFDFTKLISNGKIFLNDSFFEINYSDGNKGEITFDAKRN